MGIPTPLYTEQLWALLLSLKQRQVYPGGQLNPSDAEAVLLSLVGLEKIVPSPHLYETLSTGPQSYSVSVPSPRKV